MSNNNEIAPSISDASVNVAELIAEDYVIVCDTNVYLGLYRFSPDYANFALDCLRAVQAHIMIPYTVKIEYNKHQRSEFKLRQGKLENSIEGTMTSIDNQHKSLKNIFATLSARQFPGADNFQNEVDEKYDELKTMLTDYFEERSVLSLIHDSWTNDVVKEFVESLVDGNQVMQDFNRDMIYAICEEGKKRYDKKIPPGYKDAKNKDGIRKYSDLILWKESIQFAKEKQKNIIFVTDDVKNDWWNTKDNKYEFLPELVKEFAKDTKIRKSANNGVAGPSMKIVPFVSEDFYDAISDSMNVPKSDVVEQALKITDKDYINIIEYQAFDSIYENLKYSGFQYVDESTLTYVGSEGIEDWEIDKHELSSFKRVEHYDDQITYELIYDVEMSSYSRDYWGRDDDTKNVIVSPDYRHGVMGQLTISLIRTVDMFMDFEDSSDFDSSEIVSGDFVETSYKSCFDDEDDDVPDAYTTCPDCTREINAENDGGNGFCVECAPNH
ncbi:PIN-like domain-containing protein [Priestia megaterium]|uniref:PIN-like domain-containing protein n=1 Tax=Priestia megaterium TaxID=1404 RepID=UPI001CDB9E99|nr:PIN-like domain-containing protein [Priestia megaterium]MCA4157883.1 PIN domain-containing protein [Priestia megaterium]